ncbi:hypothetical protein HaLaN_10735 [Haematococcus lacustris]|uniref:Uncharacterized protein n=1 Tax=Haematococcus lacustris TaxID=44745 RepID=A0A699Z5M2_HAELA|nr:hypothetical protein HaLaN_10735 [Haematococcus lacustris]
MGLYRNMPTAEQFLYYLLALVVTWERYATVFGCNTEPTECKPAGQLNAWRVPQCDEIAHYRVVGSSQPPATARVTEKQLQAMVRNEPAP